MTPVGQRGGNRSKSALIAEEIWYLPTYIRDDKWVSSTGECSLFVRRFRLVETPSGVQKMRVASDVLTFEGDGAMVGAIEEHGWQELPVEAERDLLYVPDALVVEGAKVERDSGRISTATSQPSSERES